MLERVADTNYNAVEKSISGPLTSPCCVVYPISKYKFIKFIARGQRFHSVLCLLQKGMVNIMAEINKRYMASGLPEEMEFQSHMDTALIGRCVDGLSLYAAHIAMDDAGGGRGGFSPKIDELRKLTEYLVGYWGLDDGAGNDYGDSGTKGSEEYLHTFDDRVKEARTGGLVVVDTYQTASNVIYGLYRYGEDMVVSQGIDAKDDISAVSELMKEIGAAWGFEPYILSWLTVHLESEVEQMVLEQETMEAQSKHKNTYKPTETTNDAVQQDIPAHPQERTPPTPFKHGEEFWQDTLATFGRDDARIICERIFDIQLNKGLSKEDVQYHKEIFMAMYEDAAQFVDPTKLVYPYNIEYAMERSQKFIYHNSMKLNAECAKAIEETIDASLHGNHHYNLDIAAMKVIHQYGFERVNMVLAHNIQEKSWDGRFSNASKQWAESVWMPKEAFKYTNMDTNPGLLDMFVNTVRKLYQEMDAERFALPGRAESGEFIGTSDGRLQGYEIVHSIEFDNQRGFAIGHNSEGVSTYATWQFTVEGGVEGGRVRDFYWGSYYDNLVDAQQSYVARIISHMSGADIREVRREVGVELVELIGHSENDTLSNTSADLPNPTSPNPTPNPTNPEPNVTKRYASPDKTCDGGVLPADKPNGKAKRASVLEQIRESRSAAKLAAQSTQPDQVSTTKNKKKDEPEL